MSNWIITNDPISTAKVARQSFEYIPNTEADVITEIMELGREYPEYEAQEASRINRIEHRDFIFELVIKPKEKKTLSDGCIVEHKKWHVYYTETDEVMTCDISGKELWRKPRSERIGM